MSAIFTVLYIVGKLFILPHSSYIGLINDLTIGVAVTFIGWWLLVAAFIWLWRKFGYWFLAALVVIGGVILTLYVMAGMGQNFTGASPINTPPQATFTPIPSPTPDTGLGRLDPSWFSTPQASQCYSSEILDKTFLGKTICVTGYVTKIVNVRINESYGYQLGRRLLFDGTDVLGNYGGAFFLQYVGDDFSKPGDCLIIEGEVKVIIIKPLLWTNFNTDLVTLRSCLLLIILWLFCLKSIPCRLISLTTFQPRMPN